MDPNGGWHRPHGQQPTMPPPGNRKSNPEAMPGQLHSRKELGRLPRITQNGLWADHPRWIAALTFLEKALSPEPRPPPVTKVRC